MQESLVSIVIPCFNHADYVQQAIESVISQDYKNIELIIIDDGSSDESVSKIKELVSVCEARFKRFEFRHRANVGLTATINEAIDWCRGRYYSAIASDDIMLPCKTSLQVSFLDANLACAAAFGGIEIIDNASRTLRSTNKPGSYSFQDIICFKHFLPAPTQMIRLSVLRKLGGYPVGFYIEDWYMWLRITQAGMAVYCLDSVLCKYRRHEGNLSKRIDKMRLGRQQVLNEFKAVDEYSEAVSILRLLDAVDLINVSRILSLREMFSALVERPALVFTKRYAIYCFRFFFNDFLKKYS